MTLRVRDLREGEAEDLARMTRSRTLGAGLVRRAQIVQHAVEGLSPPEIAPRLDVSNRLLKNPLPRRGRIGFDSAQDRRQGAAWDAWV
jgi:hypothetical protein